MTEKLNPGSPEAVEKGCVCPIEENFKGKGYLGGMTNENGKTIFLTKKECPLHGEK